MIRVVLPYHLRHLAGVDGEVKIEIDGEVTQRSVVDALEAMHPALKGTIRDHVTKRRRPFVRIFACQQDISLAPPDSPLPESIRRGWEPVLIIGAIAGG